MDTVLAKSIFYDWFGFNRVLFGWINGVHGPYLDRIMTVLTEASSHRNFPVYVAAALLTAYLRPQLIPVRNVAVFAGAYVLSTLAVPAIKNALLFPRPLAALGSSAVVTVVPAPDMGSFPSGHTAFAFLLAASLAPGTAPLLRIGLWVFAGLVVLSRISVGAHFPADTVGGALIGIALATVARLALNLADGNRRR